MRVLTTIHAEENSAKSLDVEHLWIDKFITDSKEYLIIRRNFSNAMNTPATTKPTLKISATHIGPIMSLDAPLSKNKQNLIFARNGTGKSFLARSLRLLDEDSLEGVTPKEMPELLVSEEAPSKQGTFQLYEDQDCIGSIGLNCLSQSVSFSAPRYIFHVFSEDYVDFHLRQKSFELDGEIKHEIIVGQENLTLDAKESEVASKKENLEVARRNFDEIFAAQKKKLQDDFSINASLGGFKSLTSNAFLDQSQSSDEQQPKTLVELLADFNKFKSLPNDPKMPLATELDGLGLDWDAISSSLAKITSPSSVVEEVKSKIAADPSFFRSGLKLTTISANACPFCTQSLTEAAQLALSMYKEYFEDAEAKEKDTLVLLERSVKTARSKLTAWRTRYLTAKSNFDELKAFFPSVQDKNVEDESAVLDVIDATLVSIEKALASKQLDLSSDQTIPIENAASEYDRLVKICGCNSRLFADLDNLVNNSSSERKSIQNDACKAFSIEFGKNKSADIDAIMLLSQQALKLQSEIDELRRTQGDKADARTRVAETFTLLLKRFFGTKYTFDVLKFKVLREKKSMARGGDRTLSDGEKSVMAFCYFIAQSHLKVDSNDDYSRLYFVFDDPVTSMSSDYVYSIVQTLKLLRISAAGEIEFNPKSGNPRPRMLVLTHNNYFYNVASSNGAIPKSGLFQLVPGTTQHTLASQKGFATPHQQQLKHVYDVSIGKAEPDFMTPNSIRSVVESMWKFCRPDVVDFGAFFEFLIDECEIELKSVLINDLSHGGKFDDQPHKSDDIVEAAREAIAVVEWFAEGQLKHL